MASRDAPARWATFRSYQASSVAQLAGDLTYDVEWVIVERAIHCRRGRCPAVLIPWKIASPG